MDGWPAVLEFARGVGVIRPRDLLLLGLAPENVHALAKRGLLVRIGRGLYTLPDFEWTENHSLVEVSKAVPRGVVCLLSALRFHEIGTQSPAEVWVALPRGHAHLPLRRTVAIRTIWLSAVGYESGIEQHRIEGNDVPIYGIAKTVVDCWRFRNRVGMDVAQEALREVVSTKRVGMDELYHYAVLAKQWNIMMPYLEGIL